MPILAVAHCRSLRARSRLLLSSGMDAADGSPTRNGPPAVDFHRHRIEVVERAEGYREYRCLPATWSYPGERPLQELLTEFYSQRMAVDPYGVDDPAFWSGADAALRLRALPASDLALRELTALASRRSTGLNAPEPWVVSRELRGLAEQWEPEATDIHFSQVPIEPEGPTSLWSHYGMGDAPDLGVVTGYYMQQSERPKRARQDAWRGDGPGAWHPWSALLEWERWPRRQEAPPPVAKTADSGWLRLFVSHRWESLDHPDPNGSQLLSVKVGLTLALSAALLQDDEGAGTVSGLPEFMAAFVRDTEPSNLVEPALLEWAAGVKMAAEDSATETDFWTQAKALEGDPVRPLLNRIRDGVLVWYDFVSMFQSPRTAEEEQQFRREILELNHIQANAATVVIAGDAQYLTRAWCFLELCGGMRHHIVELIPTWGSSVGIGQSTPRWASRSDQLIGALNVLGLEAIHRSGLEATHDDDLLNIANLLSRLPLIGLVDTDDSDLVGGVIPLPMRDGKWISVGSPAKSEPARAIGQVPFESFGELQAPATLVSAAQAYAGADALTGPIGMWVYTTQRVLSLAWAARAEELWATVRAHLEAEFADGPRVLPAHGSDVSVSCMWADARALADDGLGWTRIIPSTARLLVVVTQADLPAICRIYDRVVGSHLACGVPVVTFSPETGRTTMHQPSADSRPRAYPISANVLAAPRIRRSNAYPRQLLMGGDIGAENIELLAALRLDPREGPPPLGQVSETAAEAGLGPAGAEITAAEMLQHSERRVRLEALARSTAATWDEWFAPRLDRSAWAVGMAPLQLELIEQIVRAAFDAFENPFKRRRLLKVLVTDHDGDALPPWIVEQAAELIRMLHERGP
jgi:hypothetical protein